MRYSVRAKLDFYFGALILPQLCEIQFPGGEKSHLILEDHSSPSWNYEVLKSCFVSVLFLAADALYLSVSDSFATPWTRQAPLSLEFSRQEYWSGLPFPPPGDLLDPGIKFASPALTGGFFTTETPGKPIFPHRVRLNPCNHEGKPSRDSQSSSFRPLLMNSSEPRNFTGHVVSQMSDLCDDRGVLYLCSLM